MIQYKKIEYIFIENNAIDEDLNFWLLKLNKKITIKKKITIINKFVDLKNKNYAEFIKIMVSFIMCLMMKNRTTHI